MAKIPLSAKFLQHLSCPLGSRKTVYRDAACRGLLLEVRSTGGRTWYLTYTNKRGKRHQHRLGDARDLSLAQARCLAYSARTTIALGGDPAEDQALLRSTPTFSQFIMEQYLPYIQTYKRSWKCDLSTLRVHLLPVLGDKELDTISKRESLAR